ncbi:MAG: sugar phosphate isomerase/epimerase family protein, partial [Limisphaerales bacterium]
MNQIARKNLALCIVALSLTFTSFVTAADTTSTAADQLGWQLDMHARTLKSYNLFDAMDKTAALGIKYFSLSASVPFEGTTQISVLKLTDAQIKKIKDRAAKDGLKIVNAYLQLPADEAECRKGFEFARKMGFDIIVSEPKPDALDIVEKLCKEFNIKVAIHDHPQPSHYWNPQTVLDAIKGRSPLIGACADTGHWVRSGLDPVACLKQLQGHIICLHFKDLNEKKRSAHDSPWGTGVG